MTILYTSSTDPNVDDICNEFCSRAEKGFAKYGVNTTRTDLELADWIQHLKEELMDSIVYIHRIQQELKNESK